MKLFISVIIGIITVPSFSQSLATTGNEFSVKLLTSQEVQTITKESNLMKITMKYGAGVSLNREITVKEYFDLLVSMGNKNPLKQFFSDFKEAYRQISEIEPSKRMKIPTEILVYPCGTFGCTATDRPGYVIRVGDSYWAACCPK